MAASLSSLRGQRRNLLPRTETNGQRAPRQLHRPVNKADHATDHAPHHETKITDRVTVTRDTSGCRRKASKAPAHVGGREVQNAGVFWWAGRWSVDVMRCLAGHAVRTSEARGPVEWGSKPCSPQLVTGSNCAAGREPLASRLAPRRTGIPDRAGMRPGPDPSSDRRCRLVAGEAAVAPNR